MTSAVKTAAVRVARVPGAAFAYRLAFAIVALGVVAVAMFAPHNEAALTLDRFTGSSIARGHTIATTFGSETFSAAGLPTGAIGWLGALVTYEFALRSAIALTIISAFAALATFALVERRARRTSGRVFALAAAALALTCSIGSFGPAGGIFTALFGVMLAEVLDRPGPRSALIATAIACLWCNVAGDGILAPALAFVFALAATLGNRTEEERRWRWVAFGGTLVAILATPGFLAYPAIALESLRLDRSLTGIVAFHPADVAPLAYRSGFLLAMLAAFAVGLRGERKGDVTIALGAALLALANGSYLALAGVIVAPVLAASAAATFGADNMPRLGTLRGDGVVVALALVTAMVLAPLAPQPVPAPAFALASALASDGLPHRLYCSNVEWCDGALVPGSKTRVYMDGRVGAYPESVRTTQHEIFTLKNHWTRTIDRLRLDAMLVRVDRPQAGLVALQPGWKAVASDRLGILFERAPQTR